MSSAGANHQELRAIHNKTSTMGWGLFGRAAIRQNRWRLVHVEPFGGGRAADSKWQLYDLEKDPGELDDLSEAIPERHCEMIAMWESSQYGHGLRHTPIRMGFDSRKSESEEEKDDVVSQTQDWTKARKTEGSTETKDG